MDELFDLLSDRYCRAVLAYLRDAEEDRTSIWELATEIHDGSHRKKDPVVVQLRHSTIPRLADADAVDYSPNSGLVYYRGHDELERHWMLLREFIGPKPGRRTPTEPAPSDPVPSE